MAASKPSSPTSKRSSGVAARERDLQSFRDITDDVIESDFVPYACLWNADTIATKNGEVLRTVKITGLGFDISTGGNLRAAIRKAIAESIPDASYGIWLHTLRRQRPLMQRAHFPDSFSGQLDEAWMGSRPTTASYVNELYISIVKAGSAAQLLARGRFIESLIPSRNRDARTEEINGLSQQLDTVTEKLLSHLKPFGARLLTTVKRDGLYYNEQLEFLEKLINLEERPMALPERNLSHVLTSGEITFGYNAMEVRTEEGQRRFAAILTLKEYKESTLAGIDKFLEIPCEVIVSQCFGFDNAEEVRETYAKQARILSMSGDKELAKWIEIDRLTESRNSSFGQQQTSLFLIASSVRQLEANVKLVQRALSRLGMVAIREDLRFEECYWAQLPGNFHFVVRKHPVDTEHLAGFANLQSAPMGAASGSPWGPPVSLFTTVQDTPYFFNFHRGSTAHTLVLGRPGTGRTGFTHFLIAQARKLPIQIWYLDAHGRSRSTIEAMGGKTLTPGTVGLTLNPFQLPESNGNREFLALWLSTLIDPSGARLNRASLDFFKSLVEQMLAMPLAARRLSNLLPIAKQADPFLANALAPFCAGGKYGDLFDMPEDRFATAPLISWDISSWMREQVTRVPLTSYLLHRLTAAMSPSKPTLLVLGDGFTLLDSPLFASRAAAWCDHLSSQNTACIFSIDSIDASGAQPFASSIAQKVATIFAHGDPEPSAEYTMGYGFTPEEVATIAYLDNNAHHVLQKRGSETVVLNMDFSHFSDDARATLTGRTRQEVRSPAEQLAELMGLGVPAA